MSYNVNTNWKFETGEWRVAIETGEWKLDFETPASTVIIYHQASSI